MTVKGLRRNLFWVLCCVAFVVLSVVGLLRYLDGSAQAAQAMPASDAEILMVDPDLVLKLFVEDRGLNLEGEAFTAAVQKLDRLVSQVSAETYAEFGVLVVKADLVLAGGVDYTAAFYARIAELWDVTL